MARRYSEEEQARLARTAAYGMLVDPLGATQHLGRRLMWERARGRWEGLGIAIVLVLLAGWLTSWSTSAIVVLLGVAAVVAYVLAWWIGRYR